MGSRELDGQRMADPLGEHQLMGAGGSQLPGLHGKVRERLLAEMRSNTGIDARLPDAFLVLWGSSVGLEELGQPFWDIAKSVQLSRGIDGERHLTRANMDRVKTPDLPDYVPAEGRHTLALALLGAGQALIAQHHTAERRLFNVTLDDAVSALNRSDILGRNNLETLCSLGDAFIMRRIGNRDREYTRDMIEPRMGSYTRILGAQRFYGRAIHLLGIDAGGIDLIVPEDNLKGSEGRDPDNIQVYGPWAYTELGKIRMWQSDYQHGKGDSKGSRIRAAQAYRCAQESLRIMGLPVDAIRESVMEESIARLQEDGRARRAGEAYHLMARALTEQAQPDDVRAYATAQAAELIEPSVKSEVGKLKAALVRRNPEIEAEVEARRIQSKEQPTRVAPPQAGGKPHAPVVEASARVETAARVEVIRDEPTDFTQTLQRFKDVEVGRELTGIPIAFGSIQRDDVVDGGEGLVRTMLCLRNFPSTAPDYLDMMMGEAIPGYWDMGTIGNSDVPLVLRDLAVATVMSTARILPRPLREKAGVVADQYETLVSLAIDEQVAPREEVMKASRGEDREITLPKNPTDGDKILAAYRAIAKRLVGEG